MLHETYFRTAFARFAMYFTILRSLAMNTTVAVENCFTSIHLGDKLDRCSTKVAGKHDFCTGFWSTYQSFLAGGPRTLQARNWSLNESVSIVGYSDQST